MNEPMPAGSVGFTRPDSWIGRRIVDHQDPCPYSHTVIALGDGRVWESTWLWTRITDESEWSHADWWTPRFYIDERVLRSVSYLTEGRIHYDALALFAFLFGGRPSKRRHGLFCSYGVAELLLTAADYDVSRCEKPWIVDPLTLWRDVLGPSWRPV